MAKKTSLGTIKFWVSDNSSPTKPIKKHSGYLTIKLESVFYNSTSTFFQKVFGGTNKVALSCNIKYFQGNETHENEAIQAICEVKSSQNHILPISNIVALKIPLNGDALEIKTSIVSIKNDRFDAALEILNDKDFQSPLEILPLNSNQLIPITKLVKKIFTEYKPSNELSGIVPCILQEDEPSQDFLTGYLVLMSNEEMLQNSILNNFTIKNGYLFDANNSLVESCTYVIYKFYVEQWRGHNEKSVWFHKYQEAIYELDNLMLLADKKHEDFFKKAMQFWQEGNVLLLQDSNYLQEEKSKIKDLFFLKISEKYSDFLTKSGLDPKYFLKKVFTDESKTTRGENLLEIDFEKMKKEISDYEKELAKIKE